MEKWDAEEFLRLVEKEKIVSTFLVPTHFVRLLRLPEETRNHVKKFIATHLIFEGAGGLTTMTAAEVAEVKAQKKSAPLTLSAQELAESALIEVSGRFNALVVANELKINIQQFNAWNPGFDKALAAGEKYAMRISKEKETIFLAKKNQLLLASVRAIIEGSAQ